MADRLYSLTARLAGASTANAVAEAVLAEARVAFGAERGTMTLIEEDGDTTHSLAEFGYPDEQVRPWRSYSLGDSVAPTRDAVATGRALFVESPADARERYPALAPVLEANRVETVAILPVAVDGRVRSAIGLAWIEVRVLPAEEREFLALFAS